MIEPERVMLLGDTHGNWAWTVRAVLHAADNGANVIVQLGDLGFWVPGPGRDKFLTELQNVLESRDITLYWVDGNHECVDSLTRAVTRRGFVAVDDLQGDDEVLSVDDDGNRLWLPIDGIVRRPYSGPMYRVKTRRHDMLLTPGHRVVGTSPSGKWVEHLARELNTAPSFKVTCAARGHGHDYGISDDLIRLHAWCLTDSHHRADGGWHFFQRASAAARILDLLERLEIPHTSSVRHRDIKSICGRPVKSSEPEVTVRIGVDAGRALPFAPGRLEDFAWKLSERQVQVFMDELIYCDGSLAKVGNGSGVLYGGAEDAAWWDQLQLLLVQNGYRVSRSVFRDSDWRMNFCRRPTLEITRGQTPVSVEDYSGIVWCLRVPNGRFFVERDGKVYLTGNCFEDLNPRIPDDKTPWSPKDYPRIIHLPRGYRWTWWGQAWMALGGATSIDRLQRIPGRSWWPEEALTDEDVEYASRPGAVDVLVCHDAPYGANVPGVGLGPPRPCDWPLQTQLESYDHRLKVRKVVDVVRPRLVAHGHMHCRYSDMLHLDGHDTMVEGLDCDGTPMSRSTLFINKP